ncbi:MAG: response regulator transcription factor [Magnetospirillum sp.]
MPTILIIEDESTLRSDLVSYLRVKGYDSQGVASLGEARTLLGHMAFDVYIIDIGLPDGDGSTLIPEIRVRQGFACGIIVLTAFSGSQYRINTLELGGDAYLSKAASLREIETTLRSVLRRLPAMAETAGWVVDRRSWSLVSPSGSRLELTAKEMDFLLVLAESGTDPCDRTILHDGEGSDRKLDALVRRLRHKIEELCGEDAPIRTAYGKGYAFTAPLRVDG